MDDRQPDTLTDAAIDREIRAALAVEPSPEFLARVRTRIASEPVASGFRWSWLSAGAVSAVLVGVVMFSVSRREQVTTDLSAVVRRDPANFGETSPPALSESVGRVEEKLREGGKVGVTDTATTTAVVPTFRSARAKESAVPQVLISSDDTRAFQRFVASLRERNFELSFDETFDVAETPVVTALTIQLITIEPLNTNVADQGAFQ